MHAALIPTLRGHDRAQRVGVHCGSSISCDQSRLLGVSFRACDGRRENPRSARAVQPRSPCRRNSDWIAAIVVGLHRLQRLRTQHAPPNHVSGAPAKSKSGLRVGPLMTMAATFHSASSLRRSGWSRLAISGASRRAERCNSSHPRAKFARPAIYELTIRSGAVASVAIRNNARVAANSASAAAWLWGCAAGDDETVMTCRRGWQACKGTQALIFSC